MASGRKDCVSDGVSVVQTSIRRIWHGSGQRSQEGNENWYEAAPQVGRKFLQLFLPANESAKDAPAAHQAEELFG